MNKICSCPVGSLFASIPPLYKKELIGNELPLAFYSLSRSPKEFYILSPLDHHLLILKRKLCLCMGCLNAEIPAPCKQFRDFFPPLNPVRIQVRVYFMLSQMLLVSKFRRFNLFGWRRTASAQRQECFQVLWEQINVSDFRKRCQCLKKKEHSEKGLSLFPVCQGEIKSVLNYDLRGWGGCLESSSRKVILNSKEGGKMRKNAL